MQEFICKRYGSWSSLSQTAQEFIEAALLETDYAALFAKTQQNEQQANTLLKTFDAEYPQALNEANLEDILKIIQTRKSDDPAES